MAHFDFFWWIVLLSVLSSWGFLFFSRFPNTRGEPKRKKNKAKKKRPKEPRKKTKAKKEEKWASRAAFY